MFPALVCLYVDLLHQFIYMLVFCALVIRYDKSYENDSSLTHSVSERANTLKVCLIQLHRQKAVLYIYCFIE